ncbi:fibroblast growth factor receptor substrate 2 [Salmo trutta]|uniref:Fibroblast growth factor receptor substrate 3 n=1 Tax=Salmo trutta TaxID=8032 RepID=A0A673X956_SALTR|nr:fibroblast growth factor receptor substrate 2-like [Salmo trutta]XP_029631670.1 fibroblast growth factor receptor substrate 2-like [Salmo trutta]
MGSCWSCLYRDPIQDNHLTKFKVTNVDDEGNELGSGTMELTETELILHTRKRDAIRWPYLCLRRYGYDSNLFSFESGRRCQTGQGIFAFKCSRAEEIFNLLQELMQCNSINVVEEPMIMTGSGHAREIDMPRTPQTPNTPAFPVQGFPNGYPGYPMRAESSQPSLTDNPHGHSHMGLEDQAHTYVNTVTVDGELSSRHCVHSLPEVRPTSFPESTRGAMPVVGQGGGQTSMHCCPLEEQRKEPQVFLQPSSQEVKFMLGPTPAQRHLLERERERHGGHNPHAMRPVEGATGSETEGDEPPLHVYNSHSYHHPHYHHVMHRHPGHEHQEGCQLTYENINGLRGGRRLRLSPSSMSQSVGSSSSSSTTGDSHSHPQSHPLNPHPHGPSSLPPQGYPCERGAGMGGGHRRTALLNYENLPSLPPVWEYRALQRDEEQDEDDEEQDEEEYEEEEEDFDEYEFSEGPGTPNGYHQEGLGRGGIHRDALQNYVNTEQVQVQVQPSRLRHACPPQPQHLQPCHSQPDRGGRIFSFDFRRRPGGGFGRGEGCEHSHMPPSRQLNYIQVDLDAEPPCQALGGGGGGGAQSQPQPQHQRLPPLKCGPQQAPRRSEFYAVIDLKKTAAMSNLQKALPRDDGTSRKTRHNSTDLPL